MVRSPREDSGDQQQETLSDKVHGSRRRDGHPLCHRRNGCLCPRTLSCSIQYPLLQPLLRLLLRVLRQYRCKRLLTLLQGTNAWRTNKAKTLLDTVHGARGHEGKLRYPHAQELA